MKKLTVKIKNVNDVVISLDRELSKVSFGALDRGNVSDTTNWGCFSNTGEIEFFDTNMGTADSFETVMSYAPNATVCIYYNSGNIEKLLATFLIDDYEINYETKKVSLKLKDNLVAWQEQNMDEYYGFYKKSLYDIWNATFSGETKITNSAEELMQNTSIEISYMEKSNKWANIDKICQASMTRCFCDADGTAVISDETPTNNTPIIIQPRNILSIENKVSSRNTKVKDVQISAKNYIRRTDYRVSDQHHFTWYSVVGGDHSTSWRTIVANHDLSASTGLSNDLADVYNATVTKLKHVFSVCHAVADTKKWVFKSTVGTELTTEHEMFYSFASGADFEIDDFGEYALVDLKNVKAIDRRLNSEHKNWVGTFCISEGTIYLVGEMFEEGTERNFGSESEYATQLSGNELIQVDSTFGEKTLAQHIIDTVTEKYSNGVECVVMEVTPSEYQGEDGLAIDPVGQKPLFEKYDIVVPYVIRNGREQPYSTTSDGSPKSFKVVGIEYSYSGLLRQKLHLQENKD